MIGFVFCGYVHRNMTWLVVLMVVGVMLMMLFGCVLKTRLFLLILFGRVVRLLLLRMNLNGLVVNVLKVRCVDRVRIRDIRERRLNVRVLMLNKIINRNVSIALCLFLTMNE